jgi:hypothetical protein
MNSTRWQQPRLSTFTLIIIWNTKVSCAEKTPVYTFYNTYGPLWVFLYLRPVWAIRKVCVPAVRTINQLTLTRCYNATKKVTQNTLILVTKVRNNAISFPAFPDEQIFFKVFFRSSWCFTFKHKNHKDRSCKILSGVSGLIGWWWWWYVILIVRSLTTKHHWIMNIYY